MEQRVRRSWLIVPACDDIQLDQAAGSGADVIVLDLQDTVHESKKHDARANIRSVIPRMLQAGAEVFLRADVELLYADLSAAVWRGLSGVLLPGVTSIAQVEEADQLLGCFEVQRGVSKPPPMGVVLEADEPSGPEQALELQLCLDSGKANWDAIELIHASPRVQSISLGRADLTMDLREEPSGNLHLMPYLLQRMVVVASASGVQPIGAWWQATSRGLVATPENTLRAAISGRCAGFKGALCMRANQAASLNQGFTPSAEETAHARALVEALESAQEKGDSTAVYEGEIIDAGRAAGASRLLEWAEACRIHEAKKAAVVVANAGAK